MREYSNYLGESKGKHWSVFTKNEEAPIEYIGNLYWISDQAKADNTYLESLIVKKDDEVLLHSNTETPVRDFSGGSFRDGSPKEKSISFRHT
ncbi:DUF4944 domain-containing protein [Bacillus mojavensis]|nr:DUF4944 domain-containing protein [Bacillus mojavensis]